MGEYFYFTLSIILPLQTYVTNNLENYYVLKLLLVINKLISQDFSYQEVQSKCQIPPLITAFQFIFIVHFMIEN